MILMARPQRRIYEMRIFSLSDNRDEKYRQELESITPRQNEALKSGMEFERARGTMMMRRQKEICIQDMNPKQHLSRIPEDAPLEYERMHLMDVREFMKQRAESRRLFQITKNRAQLAAFLDQRAQARRAYRATTKQVENVNQSDVKLRMGV